MQRSSLAAILTSSLLSFLLIPVSAAQPSDAPSGATEPQAVSPEKQALNQEILSEIHHTNQMEIQAGQLAKARSQDADVQKFADQLIQDHQTADTQVNQLASAQGLTLGMPQPKNVDDRREMQEQHELMNRLQTLQGADFDKNFLRTMANGHRHAISDLTAAETNVSQPVRDLIAQLLPRLQQHREIASNLLKKATTAG